MPQSQAKTKAGKERHVGKTMREFAAGDLKSGSGQTVTDPQQAKAIAMKQAGLSRPAGRSASAAGGATQKAQKKLEGRLNAKDKK